MNERIKELAEQASHQSPDGYPVTIPYSNDFVKVFAELIIKECLSQIEQAKTSTFVSLDDANRMKHFVAITKKKVEKHFGVEE